MKGRMLRRTPSSRSGAQPMGLPIDRLPADEDVEGGLALQDGGKALLQLHRCRQAIFRAVPASLRGVLLAGNPVAEMAVRKRFQEPAATAVAGGQLVVIDEGVEAVASPPVPDMPDERTVVETASSARRRIGSGASRRGWNLPALASRSGEYAVAPVRAPTNRQQPEQPFFGRPLAQDGREADDAVLVFEFMKLRRLLDQGAGGLRQTPCRGRSLPATGSRGVAPLPLAAAPSRPVDGRGMPTVSDPSCGH